MRYISNIFRKKNFFRNFTWGGVGVKITLFTITQERLDQILQSPNSTEIFIRRLYTENFVTIGSCYRELSCIGTDGRPDTQTDSIVYSLFEYTKIHKDFIRKSMRYTLSDSIFDADHEYGIFIASKLHLRV